MRLQHVSILRPAGEAYRQDVTAFYGTLLGLREIPAPESLHSLDVQWFAIGDGHTELHVLATEEDVRQGDAHFCLAYEGDFEPLRQRLIAAGYEVWEAEVIPGRPRFFVGDPFGNSVEITTLV